jgi:acyl-coenzyme A synthetase/AMP-(fatty) acid ligase
MNEKDPLWQTYMQHAGWKNQPNQLSSFPYVKHLSFADRKDLILSHGEDELNSLVNYLSGNRNKYMQFLRKKSRFPSLDLYACFQPFNEAFKALYPFVTLIKKNLKKGDIILNLWDRSGWTASMLGGWFFEQQIITVWEGDKDILGYKGFDYWMSAERRKNHSVVFADFLRPLPFEDASIAAIVGMDLLHRFHQPELLAEIHRIAKQDAPIIFPHVHLTNSLPEPFFERGCRQLHGTDYQYLFDTAESVTKRKGYILSEPATFEWNDSVGAEKKPLISAPANPDYNACIAWLPAGKEYELEKWKGHEQKDWENMYLLQNPFLIIDSVNHTLKIKEEGWGENIYELFSRHPVYAKKINKSIGEFIEEDVRCVLYYAMQGACIKNILQKTGISKKRMQEILNKAWKLDLAQCVPADETGFRLQTMLGQQKYLLAADENNLMAFWKQTVEWYGEDIWCKMGEDELSYSQGNELIQIVQKALVAEGLKKGDVIILCGELHTELLLIFWAAVSLGIIVVPLSAKQSAAKIKEYIKLVQPSFIITHPEIYNETTGAGELKVIMVDEITHPDFNAAFSFENWLEKSFEKEIALPVEAPEANDTAVILFTTGSTGNPKGVPVTHSGLIRSGRLITETYHWKKTDRYYALGGLETMSGLRHATVSVAEVGACCIIPTTTNNLDAHLQTITESRATILTANPAFYKHFLLLAKKIKTTFSLRLTLCTGNRLTDELRKSWKELMKVPLYNYYGLTESGGICIAESLEIEPACKDSIGKPLDCIIKIIDEAGNAVPAGEPGELCIYGAGVFSGYYNNTTASASVLKNGWFRTGDVVIQQEDGSVALTGRLSNIVKLISGERIEISAIEEIIEQITGLKDWAVCAVKKAEKELIAVFIVIDSPADYNTIAEKIGGNVADKIGAYAIPSFIKVVENIPRGNHNKVLQKELSDKYFAT